jgi:hypothetical protein
MKGGVRMFKKWRHTRRAHARTRTCAREEQLGHRGGGGAGRGRTSSQPTPTGDGTQLSKDDAGAPRRSQNTAFAYGPATAR